MDGVHAADIVSALREQVLNQRSELVMVFND
jgi:hypothetical protein